MPEPRPSDETIARLMDIPSTPDDPIRVLIADMADPDALISAEDERALVRLVWRSLLTQQEILKELQAMRVAMENVAERFPSFTNPFKRKAT